MSVLPIPQRTNSSTDLQVWNNSVFDNEYSDDISSSTQSWGSLKSIFRNPKESLDSVLGKENQELLMENQISSVSLSNTPFKPVNRDGFLEKSRIKRVSIKGEENGVVKQKGFLDEKKIDEEIEEIESKIRRLSSRLEALKLEKAKRRVKLEKRGRVVSAKFMEQTECVKITEEKNKNEDNSSFSGKSKVMRRGLSLGPVEIVNARRRGMSMGPSEIVGATKVKQIGKQEMITPIQSRRKSCFFKLQNIDEEKAVKSLRKVAATTNQVPSRQAVTTISSRKVAKKEDGVINSVQPKNLFKDSEKSVPATNKKALRPGRVVASRYNQNTSQVSAMRKRSLPENDKEDVNRFEKKRSLSNGKSDMDGNNDECKNLGTESRINKRWEIPSKIVVHGSGEEDEKSPECVVVGPDLLLPKIRIGRFLNESPRDSGPAKRAAELVGRKSIFGSGEEVEGSICQTLSFGEEEN